VIGLRDEVHALCRSGVDRTKLRHCDAVCDAVLRDELPLLIFYIALQGALARS
jgi:hypothetical protein